MDCLETIATCDLKQVVADKKRGGGGTQLMWVY